MLHPISLPDEKTLKTFVADNAVLVAEVAVIGAGPAGLAAALSARQNGASSVVILESRAGAKLRNNVLLLDLGIMASLQELGVDVSGFTPATDFTFIDADSGLLFQFPLQMIRKHQSYGSVLAMFPRRRPGADVLISDLESALLKRVFEDKAIRLHRGVAIHGIKTADSSIRIDASVQHSELQLSADMLAVCDGARSSVLDRLGICRLGNSRQEVAMVANFLQPGRGQIKFERADRSEEVLALCSEQGTTITVRLPLDTDLAEFEDRDQRIDFMRRHASKVGVEGAFITEPKVVEISHDRASQCQFNNSVFVLGDAARTVTPRLGLGVNWAIRDAVRFGQLLPKLQSGSRLGRYRARLEYRVRTRLATDLLLFQGWVLKRSDLRVQRKPRSARWRFWQKSLLMRFMWRAGLGSSYPYNPDDALASIVSARNQIGAV